MSRVMLNSYKSTYHKDTLGLNSRVPIEIVGRTSVDAVQ